MSRLFCGLLVNLVLVMSHTSLGLPVAAAPSQAIPADPALSLSGATSSATQRSVQSDPPLQGVIAVAAGAYHTCALTATGGVKCWGGNAGQLGDGTTMQRNTPVDVNNLTSGVIALAAGVYHTCALTTTGGVKCWGGNGHGQLGDGTTTDQTTPVDVSGLASGVTVLAAGDFHTCVLNASGEASVGDGTEPAKSATARPVMRTTAIHQ